MKSNKTYKKFYDMSSPKWNYLKHFKNEEFLRKGHNDSGELKNTGLSYDEVEKKKAKEIEDSFKSAFGVSPSKEERKEKIRSKPPRGSGYGY